MLGQLERDSDAYLPSPPSIVAAAHPGTNAMELIPPQLLQGQSQATPSPPPAAALPRTASVHRRRRNRRSRVHGEGGGEGDGMETPSTRWITARSSARRYGALVHEYRMQMGLS